ncbi:putative monovalent cation/H+ antiporter subunit F [Roseivivax jejudonensis]|uniref:Putative monovalent cation/H+ antiporter subunit F n=1 Tax=Roseivivax jejudonensis TaxID=1529041 RepID=A0A1X6Y6J8_9RHOB|nr:monovalent cation/H+ antiporter complex subunit F [Roseivivax jejudonensis]SLN12167.1 putative monovalent cation/H+ antiporter subunit F [Roseivivax jejudonensis]
MILEVLPFLSLLATLASLPRLLLGPGAADRIVAAQLAGTGAVATLILLGAATATPPLYDVALVFAALAAVTGLAFVALSGRAR